MLPRCEGRNLARILHCELSQQDARKKLPKGLPFVTALALSQEFRMIL